MAKEENMNDKQKNNNSKEEKMNNDKPKNNNSKEEKMNNDKPKNNNSKEEKMNNNKQKNNNNKEGRRNHKVGFFAGGMGVLIIVLAIVTALLLLPETPEKTVEGMLNSLKNGDLESVNKYVNYDEILSQSKILQNSEMDQEMQALLFDKLTWKILNITKEENLASVEIEITNKDFDAIISNYTQEALRIAFSGESFTEEEQINKLKEQLKNEEIESKTVTTTVQVINQDGKWKVQVEESLVNSLLPGLQEAINSLNSIING